MLLENSDYFVRFVPFPNGAADGAVMPNDDGTYSVYIDINAEDKKKKAALEHELRHIELGHFDRDISVVDAEAEANDTIIEKRDYFTSWLDWMEWCRREMIKKGVKPMEL